MIVLSVVLAYSNSLQGPFVFDDIPTIVDSPSIRQLWPAWPLLFNAEFSTAGRPLVNLSLALNYAYGGLDVTPYHVTNIAIHLLAGLVLFGLVRRTLEQSVGSVPLHKWADLIALFCALLWTLHPLQTESVTYVIQRCESLVGLFYLLTIYCAMRAAESGRSTLWATASFFSCLCGVASKEVIVSVPLTVIVYDWAFRSSSIRSLIIRRRWLYGFLFSTWIPLILLVSLGRDQTAGLGHGLSAWDYSMTQFVAIAHYLQLCFWPDSLVLDYGASVFRNPREILPCAILVGLLACGSLVAARYNRVIAFLGFFFFATLSPSSSVIPIVTQTAAEHRMYLPLVPVVVVSVVMIWQLSSTIVRALCPRGVAARFESLVPGLLLLVIAVCFGALTHSRNFEYGDKIRLWTTNVKRCPDSLRAYLQIAVDYLEKDPDTANEWLDRALEGYQLAAQHNKLSKQVEIQLAGIHTVRSMLPSKRTDRGIPRRQPRP